MHRFIFTQWVVWRREGRWGKRVGGGRGQTGDNKRHNKALLTTLLLLLRCALSATVQPQSSDSSRNTGTEGLPTGAFYYFLFIYCFCQKKRWSYSQDTAVNDAADVRGGGGAEGWGGLLVR